MPEAEAEVEEEEEEEEEEAPALATNIVVVDDVPAQAPSGEAGASSSAGDSSQKKVPRWVLSDEAKRALEAVYQQRRFPTLAMREKLSTDLGGTLRQIQVWFQNRRQRDHRAHLDNPMPMGMPRAWGWGMGQGYPPGMMPPTCDGGAYMHAMAAQHPSPMMFAHPQQYGGGMMQPPHSPGGSAFAPPPSCTYGGHPNSHPNGHPSGLPSAAAYPHATAHRAPAGPAGGQSPLLAHAQPHNAHAQQPTQQAPAVLSVNGQLYQAMPNQQAPPPMPPHPGHAVHQQQPAHHGADPFHQAAPIHAHHQQLTAHAHAIAAQYGQGPLPGPSGVGGPAPQQSSNQLAPLPSMPPLAPLPSLQSLQTLQPPPHIGGAGVHSG